MARTVQSELGQQPVLHLLRRRHLPGQPVHGLGRGHRRHGACRRPAQGRAAAQPRQDRLRARGGGREGLSHRLGPIDAAERLRLRPARGPHRAAAGRAAGRGAAAGRVAPGELWTTGRSATCRASCGPATPLVFNDTRVIPARLNGRARARRRKRARSRRPCTGGSRRHRWTAFMRPGKRLAAGDRVVFGETRRPRLPAGRARRHGRRRRARAAR